MNMGWGWIESPGISNVVVDEYLGVDGDLEKVPLASGIKWNKELLPENMAYLSVVCGVHKIFVEIGRVEDKRSM